MRMAFRLCVSLTFSCLAAFSVAAAPPQVPQLGRPIIPPPAAPNELEAAIMNSDESKVRELIANGADVNDSKGFGLSTLFLATSKKNIPIFDMLVQSGAGDNFSTATWSCLFVQAVGVDSLPLAKRILKHGADPLSECGQTPMAVAISDEMRDFLFLLGANPRQKGTNFGRLDALQQRAFWGDAAGVRYLLRKVKYDEQELTVAFTYAICRGAGLIKLGSRWTDDEYFEVPKLLVEAGIQKGEIFIPCQIPRRSDAFTLVMSDHGASMKGCSTTIENAEISKCGK